ncbi:MAG: hypothetical protein ACWGHH_08110 [Sulfurovaceae bacterium]
MSSKLRYFIIEEQWYLLIIANEAQQSIILVLTASLLAWTTSLKMAVFLYKLVV